MGKKEKKARQAKAKQAELLKQMAKTEAKKSELESDIASLTTKIENAVAATHATRGGREGADGARGHHRDRGAACGAWVGEGTPSSCSGKGTEAWLQFIGRSLTPIRTPLHHVHAKC